LFFPFAKYTQFYNIVSKAVKFPSYNAVQTVLYAILLGFNNSNPSVSARRTLTSVGVLFCYLARSCQNATALAAATFSESTSWDMGMRTV